jgi:hypothetical protein
MNELLKFILKRKRDNGAAPMAIKNKPKYLLEVDILLFLTMRKIPMDK